MIYEQEAVEAVVSTGIGDRRLVNVFECCCLIGIVHDKTYQVVSCRWVGQVSKTEGRIAHHHED